MHNVTGHIMRFTVWKCSQCTIFVILNQKCGKQKIACFPCFER